MGVPFLGQITMFAGNFAPRGWALCQGQILGISQNTALFSILGTTYGGNGQTTFALPDLRSRVPVGQGQGPGLSSYTLGEQTGGESVTLQSSNLPPFAIKAFSDTGDSSRPSNNYPATTNTTSYNSTSDGSTMNPGAIVGGGTSSPFSVIPPVLCLNYIICVEGIYPSRN